ncbi:MAG: hypothetical protein Q8J76_08855, partial [Desulfobulbaceae bacterium]|nr:hypothetical protein [Desulfobulbaceae bacterium]
MNRRALMLVLTLITLLCPSMVVSADFVLSGVISDVNGQPVRSAEVSLYRSKNVKKPADFASNRTT